MTSSSTVSCPSTLPASAAEEGFLALICHELRTPLQTILGQGELLLRDATDDVARMRLGAIGQHGALMLRLVNDLLDWHASEAGEFQLKPKPVDLSALVVQTVESFRPAVAAKRLDLVCSVAADAPRWVQLDGDRVRQVLLNLLGNAIKFTDVGRVVVALGRTATGDAELSVTDTGPGITAAEQARIFRPFARVERTSETPGTGLGLALAARLCVRLGGELSVASDGESGTTFTAHFAAAPCAPVVPLEATRAMPELRGQRVLVADDNPLVRELFTAHLTQLGARCECVSDGAQAVERALESDFGVVVLDLSMPGFDGFEVARRLRARRGNDLRIVGASAHAEPTERSRAIAAGMDAFLAKPVELADLTAALGVNERGVERAGTQKLRKTLAAQFRQDARLQAEALWDAWSKSDWAALAKQAHYVRNSALVVADDSLASACAELWRAACDGEETMISVAWQNCDAALAAWVSEPDRTYCAV